MERIKSQRIPNTALLFMLSAPFSILFYGSYIFNPVHAGDPLLYILQVIADIISICIMGSLWLTILLHLLQPEQTSSDFKYHATWLSEHPLKVDILIPVVNEPIEIVEHTIMCTKKIEYPHTTYILDDGPSEEMKQLAKKHTLQYIARPKHQKKFAKSGNINYALQNCNGDFFAVFDSDHAPKKEFLSALLPFFEDTHVALVQSPQHYQNTDSFIASGTAQAQDVFYKYVQPAKNSYNASFCVGTNMVYRRSAIDAIGGIASVDHSEDIWTSILLHEKGYRSVFYNHILAVGRAPETIGAFFRQQNRWSRGGFSLFFTHNPLFIDGLTLDQKLQYFFSNIHYFSAFSIVIYLSLPVIYLLTGLHPMDVMHNQGWLTHYLPYFITLYFLPIFLLGSLKLSTISVSISSFYPYIKAFFSVVLKNQYKWIATESKSKKKPLIMWDIWPHTFIIILSFLSLIVGWYNPYDTTTTLVTSFWVVANAYFIFTFIKHGLIKEIAG